MENKMLKNYRKKVGWKKSLKIKKSLITKNSLFYWTIVDLQCWVSFKCTTQGFSFIYVCVCVLVYFSFTVSLRENSNKKIQKFK